jgi:predicted glycosyltransferase
VRIWIDIDDAPQARYLVSFARHFEQAGDDVLLTARAYGDTFAILRREGAAFETIGLGFTEGIPRQLYGLVRRIKTLVSYIGRQAPFDLVLTGSKAATMAARRLGIPSFVIVDDEHTNVLFPFEFSGATILHPSAISASVLRRRGVRDTHLIPFHGLVEDISFAGLDIASIRPHEFGRDPSHLRVLFQLPAKHDRHFNRGSREVVISMLQHLVDERASVVISPECAQQLACLDDVPAWQEQPIVLDDPVPVIPLLKGVDAVVGGGGTILREAAFLGVPAYGVFGGAVGAVDRYLASIGRLSILSSPHEVGQIGSARSRSRVPLREGSAMMDKVVELIVGRALAGSLA